MVITPVIAWLSPGGSVAYAVEPELTVASSAAVTPGTRSPGVAVSTAVGAAGFEGTSSPALRFGLSANAGLVLDRNDRLWARWGVWRDQGLCDTCDEQGPVRVGPDLVGSTDLDLGAVHSFGLGGAGQLWVVGLLTLPASRDALVCNAMIAAPGVGTSFRLGVGEGLVAVGVSARRPVWAQGAAAVGSCADGSRAAVNTLAGAATAEPWTGRWGRANPILSATGSLQLLEAEDWVDGVDDHLTTSASVSLLAARDGRAGDVLVDTLAGAAAVPASHEPLRVAVPWSVSAGWTFAQRTTLSGSLSNSLPAVLADPGGALRAQPASTQFGLTVSATFPAQPEEIR